MWRRLLDKNEANTRTQQTIRGVKKTNKQKTTHNLLVMQKGGGTFIPCFFCLFFFFGTCTFAVDFMYFCVALSFYILFYSRDKLFLPCHAFYLCLFFFFCCYNCIWRQIVKIICWLFAAKVFTSPLPPSICLARVAI